MEVILFSTSVLIFIDLTVTFQTPLKIGQFRDPFLKEDNAPEVSIINVHKYARNRYCSTEWENRSNKSLRKSKEHRHHNPSYARDHNYKRDKSTFHDRIGPTGNAISEIPSPS